MKQSVPSPASATLPKLSLCKSLRLLVIFCVINLLNYVDRGAIASNGVNGSIGVCDASRICQADTGIQGDFKLSNFQDGALSSAFIVGLLVASPIFAALEKSHNPFRLIGVGLCVWTFATAGCGGSIDFWTIAICRMVKLKGFSPAGSRKLSEPIETASPLIEGRSDHCFDEAGSHNFLKKKKADERPNKVERQKKED